MKRPESFDLWISSVKATIVAINETIEFEKAMTKLKTVISKDTSLDELNKIVEQRATESGKNRTEIVGEIIRNACFGKPL